MASSPGSCICCVPRCARVQGLELSLFLGVAMLSLKQAGSAIIVGVERHVLPHDGVNLCLHLAPALEALQCIPGGHCDKGCCQDDANDCGAAHLGGSVLNGHAPLGQQLILQGRDTRVSSAAVCWWLAVAFLSIKRPVALSAS